MGGSLFDNETRPGQSSAAQAEDAGLVRILCAAREGAYALRMNRPLRTRMVGGVGGWGLETPGYPIRRPGGDTPDGSGCDGKFLAHCACWVVRRWRPQRTTTPPNT